MCIELKPPTPAHNFKGWWGTKPNVQKLNPTTPTTPSLPHTPSSQQQGKAYAHKAHTGSERFVHTPVTIASFERRRRVARGP